MDLDSMKYAELRRLAKEFGLKSNMKADKLLKVLKQHYQQQQQQQQQHEDGQDNMNDGIDAQDDNNNAEQHIVQEEKSETPSKPVNNTPLFVTKRRGKGTKKTKRKISETETDCDPKLPLSPAKVENEVAESSADGGAGSAKRRRVSPAKDTEMILPSEESVATNNEQQPEMKDEVPAVCDKRNEPKVAKAGKIPRHEGLLKKTKAKLKPATPNFKKLHEAHFNKMESIDSYVQRKTKQMESYRNSVKELKMLSEKTMLKSADGKIQAKANPSRVSMFSPVPVDKRLAADRRRHTLLSASKPAQNKPANKEDALFRPSVLSTRRINVRFTEATLDNEYKMSLVKTPARRSPCVSSSTPGKQANDALQTNIIKTAVVSATKTPGTFVFNANTSVNTPGTNKTTFDLKASLTRPLSYRPHKGKLKPFGGTKENTAANKSLISESHQKNYKQPKVQTREERRAKHMDDRKQKKESMLGARRGLVLT